LNEEEMAVFGSDEGRDAATRNSFDDAGASSVATAGDAISEKRRVAAATAANPGGFHTGTSRREYPQPTSPPTKRRRQADGGIAARCRMPGVVTRARPGKEQIHRRRPGGDGE